MIYFELFLAFLQIGAFSFGGGYAAMPLIKGQVVERYHWMTTKDFTDLITISQITPGPIAINAASFVGHSVAGVLGAIIATLAVILPSCIFVTFLAWIYTKYRDLTLMQGILRFLRPTVVALIFVAGLDILLPALFPNGFQLTSHQGQVLYINPMDWQVFILFLIGLFFLRVKKMDPVLVMFSLGIVEAIIQTVS